MTTAVVVVAAALALIADVSEANRLA